MPPRRTSPSTPIHSSGRRSIFAPSAVRVVLGCEAEDLTYMDRRELLHTGLAALAGAVTLGEGTTAAALQGKPTSQSKPLGAFPLGPAFGDAWPALREAAEDYLAQPRSV